MNEKNLLANLEHLLGPDNCTVEDIKKSDEKILFVDVGGGRGQSLKAFRKHMPGLKGRMIVQGLPKVVEDQTTTYGVEAMAHDLFSHQPVRVTNAPFSVLPISPSLVNE